MRDKIDYRALERPAFRFAQPCIELGIRRPFGTRCGGWNLVLLACVLWRPEPRRKPGLVPLRPSCPTPLDIRDGLIGCEFAG